jgi:hypothetical protein
LICTFAAEAVVLILLVCSPEEAGPPDTGRIRRQRQH